MSVKRPRARARGAREAQARGRARAVRARLPRATRHALCARSRHAACAERGSTRERARRGATRDDRGDGDKDEKSETEEVRRPRAARARANANARVRGARARPRVVRSCPFPSFIVETDRHFCSLATLYIARNPALCLFHRARARVVVIRYRWVWGGGAAGVVRGEVAGVARRRKWARCGERDRRGGTEQPEQNTYGR